MKLIEDKEVGELWRRTLDHLTWPEPLAIENDVIALIRKIVEERAARIYERDPSMTYSMALNTALRELGIDPKDWPA